MGKKILKVAAVLLVVLLICAGIFHKKIRQVYGASTLFDAGVIDENFRSGDKTFPSKIVHRGGPVFEFKRRPAALPETYMFKGKAKNLRQFLDHTGTTGMVVIKDDTILFEKYYRGNTEKSRTISWSVAKSFISALLGVAVKEGYIKDIKQPITDYVPKLKGSGYDGVPIKDIMNMSSGIRFNEDYADFFSDLMRMGRTIAFGTSLDDFVASLKNEKKPGTYRHYVSSDTQALGMLLRDSTKKNITSYLEGKIWKKIGMEADAYFLVDGDGMEMVFGGLNAVLRDYARFGVLFLNNGRWGNEQVIPAEWVKASITPDAPHLMPGSDPKTHDWTLGYGYQWWIPENPDGDFLAIGIYGEFIYIYPKYRVVIAKSSAYVDYNKDGDDMEIETIEMFRSIARQAR
jgi:CubicO group peptidase (beta-lactamase class C family)